MRPLCGRDGLTLYSGDPNEVTCKTCKGSIAFSDMFMYIGWNHYILRRNS